MFRDYKVVCVRHGFLAIVTTESEPENALCFCNDRARVVDSGRHDVHNDPGGMFEAIESPELVLA